jgi:hypothetical protein
LAFKSAIEFKNFVDKVKVHYETTFDKIMTNKVTKDDIPILNKNIEGLLALAMILDIDTVQNFNMELFIELEQRFKELEETQEQLRYVISFLGNRQLCPDHAELRRLLDDILPTMILADLICRIKDVSNRLGIAEDILRALKVFAKDSDLFASRFDQSNFVFSTSRNQNQSLSTMIEQKTRLALEELQMLVSDENAHIDDFNVNFAGQIVNLAGNVPRQRKLEREMSSIAQFFSQQQVNPRSQFNIGHQNILEASVQKLNATFKILRLRDIYIYIYIIIIIIININIKRILKKRRNTRNFVLKKYLTHKRNYKNKITAILCN